MARTHTQDHDTHPTDGIAGEMPPVAINGEDLAAHDAEAWTAAASEREYRVDGGVVWIYQDGRLSPLPALPGFALLPQAVRKLVFTSVAQFVTNRVAQTAEGDVNAAVAAAIAGEEIPNSRDNDAYRAALRSWISDLIDLQVGPLPERATAEEKKERAKWIESEMDYDAHPQGKIIEGVPKTDPAGHRLALAVAQAKANHIREAKERKRQKSMKKATGSRLAVPAA